MNRKSSSSSSARKMKFTPKVPKRMPPRLSPLIITGADQDAEPELMLKRSQENIQGRKRTNDEQSSASVASRPEATAPTTSAHAASRPEATTPTATSQTSIVIRDQNILESGVVGDDTDILPEPVEDVLESNSEEETYEEPWDYKSYYPTTLPMRRPYSGNPAILDEAEFGEAAANQVYNEKNVNTAAALGFLDESERESLLQFQFPNEVPRLAPLRSSLSNKGKAPIDQAPPTGSQKCSRWEDLPAGRVGKLLVYNSGKVKLMLGETPFVVDEGTTVKTSEQVMVLNLKTRDGCFIGDVEKHVTVSVDVHSILDEGTAEKR